MRDIYLKRAPGIFGMANIQVPPGTPLNSYLEDLAMEQHRLSLVSGHSEVYQWNAHTVRLVSLIFGFCGHHFFESVLYVSGS